MAPHWHHDEDYTLMYNKKSGKYNWKEIANKVNEEHHNNRTDKGCSSHFRRLRKNDTYKDFINNYNNISNMDTKTEEPKTPRTPNKKIKNKTLKEQEQEDSGYETPDEEREIPTNINSDLSKETDNENTRKKKIFTSDKFNPWSHKSKNIPFKSSKQCVGNGEDKLAKELDISSPPGGQNSTYDLTDPDIGKISVKDMTKDNCILGTEGSKDMRKIFRKTINLFVSWILKYKSKCELANKFYIKINEKYGRSRTTIIDGIDKLELSETNLQKLNELFNELKKHKSQKKYESLNSEYVNDIINSLNDNSLQDMLNESVRQEAIRMTLIIVHEKKGWLFVKDINKLTCPRITRGSPRINYS